MTRLVTFACPKCGLTVEALAGSTVDHQACPNNQRQAVRMTPQPDQTRKEPTP